MFLRSPFFLLICCAPESDAELMFSLPQGISFLFLLRNLSCQLKSLNGACFIYNTAAHKLFPHAPPHFNLSPPLTVGEQAGLGPIQTTTLLFIQGHMPRNINYCGFWPCACELLINLHMQVWSTPGLVYKGKLDVACHTIKAIPSLYARQIDWYHMAPGIDTGFLAKGGGG